MNANVRVLPDLLIVESNVPSGNERATEAARELCLTGWVEGVIGYKTHPEGIHYPLVEDKNKTAFNVTGYSYEDCHMTRKARGIHFSYYVMGFKAGEVVAAAKKLNLANAELLEKERAYLLETWNVQLNNLRVRWQGIIPIAVQRRQNAKAAWEPEEEFFPDQEKVTFSDIEYAVETLKRISSTSNVARVYNFKDVNLSFVAVIDLATLANIHPNQIVQFYGASMREKDEVGMLAVKNDRTALSQGFQSGIISYVPAAWAEDFLAGLSQDYEGIILETIPEENRHTSAHFRGNRELVGKYYYGQGLSYLLVFVD